MERYNTKHHLSVRNIALNILLPILFFTLIFAPSSMAYAAEGSADSELKRGERFFKGLLPFNRKHEACVSCHNILPVDTLNWNPSAYEIALKYVNQDFMSFNNAVMQPVGGKMAEVHKDFKISDEDLYHVKAYLDNMAETGAYQKKPTYFNLILFLFLGLVITWALIELLFIRKLKYKFIPVILFLASLGVQAQMLVNEAISLGRQQYYAPNQPVKFSHAVHVGEQGIDCMYCHTTVEQSKSAGFPATNLCLNCHSIVREGTNSGRFEIAKIIEAAETGQNLEWVRIHNLPDHVYFNHAQHVNSGRLDCASCHGPVETMHTMMQVHDLSMGWCLDCHRTTEVQFTSNSFYDTYEKLHEQLKKGEITRVTASMVGGEDCMKCHY